MEERYVGGSLRALLSWLVCGGALFALTACPGEDDGNQGQEDGDGGTLALYRDGGGLESDAARTADGATALDHDGSQALQGERDADTACTTCDDAGGPPGSGRPFKGNGISGKVDGSEVTYPNFILFPNNTGDGRLMMEASAPSYLAKWRIFVPGTPGTYECDDAAKVTVVQLIDAGNAGGSGSASGMGSCTVTVLTAADGVYYGTFAASLVGSTAGTFKTVTEGYFYYDMYGGTTNSDELGADEQGASFKIDGMRHTYTTADPLAFETYTGINARPMEASSPGFPLGIQIHTLPNAVGSYDCGEGAAYRALNVWFSWKGASYHAGARQSQKPEGPAGSSCTVNVTTVGTIVGFDYAGTLEGTFSGTFVTNEGSASVVVTDGTFRVKGTASP